MYLAFYAGSDPGAFGYFQIVKVLQIKPEFGVGVEVSGQAQSRIRRNPAALIDDFADASSWHVKVERQLVDR